MPAPPVRTIRGGSPTKKRLACTKSERRRPPRLGKPSARILHSPTLHALASGGFLAYRAAAAGTGCGTGGTQRNGRRRCGTTSIARRTPSTSQSGCPPRLTTATRGSARDACPAPSTSTMPPSKGIMYPRPKNLVLAVLLLVAALPAASCGPILDYVAMTYTGPPPQKVNLVAETVIIRRIFADASGRIQRMMVDRERYLASEPHSIDRVVKVLPHEVLDAVSALNLQVGDRIQISTRFPGLHGGGRPRPVRSGLALRQVQRVPARGARADGSREDRAVTP